MAMCEIDVVFVEDSGPLEGRSCDRGKRLQVVNVCFYVEGNSEITAMLELGRYGKLTVDLLACVAVAVFCI